MPRAERPLDLDGSPLSGFAADLRKLREKAGSPPYRDLARRAHFSSTTLSDAAGGRRLPSLAVTVAYVAACGGDLEAWERRWHAVAAELHAEREMDSLPHGEEGPYVGLAAYGQDDAGRFFGRERLVNDLVSRSSRQRFLAVFGPSGAGKSSALRAGLIPHLRAAAEAGPVVLLTPTAHPLKECAVRLAPLLGTTASVVEADLSGGSRALLDLGDQLLLDKPAGSEVFVVVDQFEEVFTLCADSDERSAFLDLLLAASSTGSRCRVVLGVRADFYVHCAQHAGLAAAMQDAQVTVGPMTAEELRRAITRPASAADCAVESDLLSVLIAHTHGQAGALPLLSHALAETWRLRKGNTLTLAGFHAAGGIDGALARTAEAVFCGLSIPQQHLAQQLLKRLVVLGEGTEDTKRRVPRSELDDTEDTAAVLQALSGARLLTLDRDTVEITHEALIGAWPRLQRWLNTDREGIRLHRELSDATSTWNNHDQDPTTVLRGNRLTLIADWAQGSDSLTSHERAFLKASVAVRNREQSATRRRIRRQRALIAMLAVIAVAASATLIFAINAQQTATQQRNTALALRAATTAINLMESDPKLAAHIALAAYRLAPSQETREALNSAAAISRSATLTPGQATISNDSQTIAIADSGTNKTTIFSVSDNKAEQKATISTPTTPKDPVISPDGKLLAIPTRGGVLEIWRITPLIDAPVKQASIKGANHIEDWTADGRYILTLDMPDQGPDEPQRDISRPAVWDLANPSMPLHIDTLGGGGKFVDDPHLIAAPRLIPSDGRTDAVDLVSVPQKNTTRNTWLPGEKNWPVVDLKIIPSQKIAYTLQTTGIARFAIVAWDFSNLDSPVRRGKFILPDGASPRLESLSESNSSKVVVWEGDLRSLWNLSDIAHPQRVAAIATGGAVVNHLQMTPDGESLLGIGVMQSMENTLIRWELNSEKSAANVCTANYSQAHLEQSWEQYFPGLSYRSPC